MLEWYDLLLSAQWRRRILPVPLVVFFAAPAVGSDLRETFAREAQPHWQRYAEFGRRLQGDSTSISRNIDTGETATTATRLKRNTRCEFFLDETRRRKRDGTEEYVGGNVTGHNPDYSFSLQRRTDNGPWVLTSLTMRAAATADPESSPDVFLLVVSSHFILPELVNRPGFHVDEMSRVDANGEKYVRLRFRLRPPDKPLYQYQGSLEIDPHNCWCARYAHIQLVRDGVVIDDSKTWHEYEADGGIPLPRARTTRKSFKTGDGRTDNGETVVKSNRTEPKSLPPDSEFYLSAFGLQEPPGVNWPSPTPWWLWVLGVGVLCLLGGVVFRWLKRRAA